jgi:hypothetical protein
MQGGSEVTLSAHATLTSTTTKQVWARPPIDIDFQVLMFTASGLIVRFLKVFEKSSYPSVKWVRYLTKASGSYQVRVSKFELSSEKAARTRTDRCLDAVLRCACTHVSRSQCHQLVRVRVQASLVFFPPLSCPGTVCLLRNCSHVVSEPSVTLSCHISW